MSASRLLPIIALSTMLASPAAHAFADNDARKAILDLRQQIKSMTEQNARARLQLADQIERLQNEVIRLRAEIEQSGRPQQSNTDADGTPKVSDPQEQAAYDGAIDQYRNGLYKDAAESLGAFLALYSDSQLAPTARFYLGSSLYAAKDYKNSVTELQKMLEQHPDSPRAPDALLVLAGSQFELNDRAGAKASLQRIVRDYAGTPAAETATSRLELL